MKKRVIAVLALVALVGAGAFAQLAIGMSGALYSDTSMSAHEAADQFQEGEGIFYGPFIELGLDKLALGLSGNFSFYSEDFSFAQDGSYMMKMVDYDIALYIQGHLLGYKSPLDPFLEAGLGVMAKDFAENDPTTTTPSRAPSTPSSASASASTSVPSASSPRFSICSPWGPSRGTTICTMPLATSWAPPPTRSTITPSRSSRSSSAPS